MQRGVLQVFWAGILPVEQPQMRLLVHVFDPPQRRRTVLNHLESWAFGGFGEDTVRVRRRGNLRKHASAARFRNTLPNG